MEQALPPTSSGAPSGKRRRGRQPRPSQLTPELQRAVREFASKVGQPRVIEPAGFRDFRGWLSVVGGPGAVWAWQPLVDALVAHTGGDREQLHALKADLVREIVRNIVIPRRGESSKLVSTNCGRQCARPPASTTLMTIVDKVLDDVPAWRAYAARVAAAAASSPMQFPIWAPHTGAPQLATNAMRSTRAAAAELSSAGRSADAALGALRAVDGRSMPSLPAAGLAVPHGVYSGSSSVGSSCGSLASARAGGAGAGGGSSSTGGGGADGRDRRGASLPSFGELEHSIQGARRLGKRRAPTGQGPKYEKY